MTSYLYADKIRIFDYPHFAEPMRDAIRNNAEALAIKNGIEIEFIRRSHIRKEDIISKILERRGAHRGLVHILSAMEACQSYKLWHNKTTGKTLLKEDRFITVGDSPQGYLLVVSHTERGDTIRIISARPATLSERKRHEN